MRDCIENLYFQPIVTCKDTPSPPGDDLYMGFWGYLYSYRRGQKIIITIHSSEEDKVTSSSEPYYIIKSYPSQCHSASLVYWGINNEENLSFFFINNESILTWEKNIGLVIKQYSSSQMEDSFCVNDEFYMNGYISTERHRLVFTYSNTNLEPIEKINVYINYPNCANRKIGLTLGNKVIK